MTERRGRKLKQLLDDVTKTKKYRKLKEETLAITPCITGFGSGCGTDIRQTT